MTLMTLQEFRKVVDKTNWYDKYYYYLISAAALIASIYAFYDIGTNPGKYKNKHSYEIALIAFSFFLLGCYAVYLILNRYKAFTIDNGLPVDRKKKIISELLYGLGVSAGNIGDNFYTFKYHRKWWTSDYDVYLYVDSENFYVSVLGRTHAWLRSGFFDFGGANRLRKKIVSIIEPQIE